MKKILHQELSLSEMVNTHIKTVSKQEYIWQITDLENQSITVYSEIFDPGHFHPFVRIDSGQI